MRSVMAAALKTAASGQALAKAMRIRLAVSTTRAATLISRARSVANSAARICGSAIATAG
jgi:hypothetical protein